jgi:hypothetical protein
MHNHDNKNRTYITRHGRILVYCQCLIDWAHMAPDMPATVTTNDQVSAMLAAAEHLKWLTTWLITDAGFAINLLDVYNIWHKACSSLYIPDHMWDLYGIHGPRYNPINPAKLFLKSWFSFPTSVLSKKILL